MKSLEDRKREILRNPPKKLMGKGLKSFDTIDYAKWISQLNALDKQRYKNCKEEKLNMVAKHFKKYNKTLKLRVDEVKMIIAIEKTYFEWKKNKRGYSTPSALMAKALIQGKSKWLRPTPSPKKQRSG